MLRGLRCHDLQIWPCRVKKQLCLRRGLCTTVRAEQRVEVLRCSSHELAQCASKFPYRNGFTHGLGKDISAQEVLASLSGSLADDRLQMLTQAWLQKSRTQCLLRFAQSTGWLPCRPPLSVHSRSCPSWKVEQLCIVPQQWHRSTRDMHPSCRCPRHRQSWCHCQISRW